MIQNTSSNNYTVFRSKQKEIKMKITKYVTHNVILTIQLRYKIDVESVIA